ncbi:hypothetical protein BpHYR1_010851 [Brachionus plicatilis]|uniref:Uncharacterized protein n=1 Tax=Brachionus plicatilis TaxID=10195 RepID=A0A3M7PIX9_BRAPC|nr:hypothetical protein BpHYR1_010851 [Brachionus plicatilis]
MMHQKLKLNFDCTNVGKNFTDKTKESNKRIRGKNIEFKVAELFDNFKEMESKVQNGNFWELKSKQDGIKLRKQKTVSTRPMSDSRMFSFTKYTK